MTRIPAKFIVFLVTILYLTCIAAYAQSLADIAREEQKRRDSISGRRTIIFKSEPPLAVFDEEVSRNDLHNDLNDEENENAYDEPENPQNAYDEKDEEKSGPDEAAVPYGKSETQWRKAASDARSRIKQLEDEAKSLTSRRNALQRQHKTNVSQRGPIRDEINKTIQAQEQNGKNLEQARRELQSLQNETVSKPAIPPSAVTEPTVETPKAAVPDYGISSAPQAVSTRSVYSVQVAAFRARRGAEVRAKELEAKGFEYRIEQPQTLDDYYRLRVGGFATRAEAAEMAGRLKESGFEAIIIETNGNDWFYEKRKKK